MLSHRGTDFAEKMGYRGEKGGWMPGISVFKKDGDRILRVSDQQLGHGDDFCSVYHFPRHDARTAGADWRPKFSYQ